MMNLFNRKSLRRRQRQIIDISTVNCVQVVKLGAAPWISLSRGLVVKARNETRTDSFHYSTGGTCELYNGKYIVSLNIYSPYFSLI